MTELNKKIGKVVGDIRKEYKFTQEDFAKKVLDISKRHLRRIENGTVEISLKKFINISEYFGINIGDFINRINLERDSFNLMPNLYFLLNQPSTNNLLIKKIDDIYSKIENNEIILSKYDYKNLEMCESFFLFQKHDDYTYIRYFIENNEEFVSINPQAITLLIPRLKVTDVLEKVKSIDKLIEKRSQVNKYDLQVLIYSHAIGHLLTKKYDNEQEILQLFVRFKKKIISSEKYYYLLTYYRHQCYYYYFLNKRKKMCDAKQKLDSLLEFTSEDIKEEISKDIRGLYVDY